MQKYRANNPEKIKKYHKDYVNNNYDKVQKLHAKYREKNRDKIRLKAKVSRRKYRLKCLYGMTEIEYLALIKIQENKCAICGKELTNTNIDHDHATGKVRGILCDNCNHGLGLFFDNINSLYSAITYLKRSKAEQ